MEFQTMIALAKQIREKYHQLEEHHHGSRWSVEEDALAFLTDAALVGRLTMAEQKRWPAGPDSQKELKHKLGECIWWLMVLADRMDIDLEKEVQQFLQQTRQHLEE